jgi:integrative and conjugative element protein (TIGR02256 family)
MIFSSQDGRLCIEILLHAQQIITEEVAKHHPYETGGILIGKYDENLKLAAVYTATKANNSSIHRFMSFERSPRGIGEEIKRAQEKISSDLHYIGEWHTHPDNRAIPSCSDLQQMQVFAKNRQLGIKSPLLLIVGGSLKTGLIWGFSLHRHRKKPLYFKEI